MPSPLQRARATVGTGTVGLFALSRVIARSAPYFTTIRPRLTRFDPGHVQATMKKRRAVTNHLGTVHAIAMCNLAEFVGGTATDLACPDTMRWIPVGMSVQYLKLAKTHLTGTARIEDLSVMEQPGDVVVPVRVVDTDGVVVFSAQITMRVSAKKGG